MPVSSLSRFFAFTALALVLTAPAFAAEKAKPPVKAEPAKTEAVKEETATPAAPAATEAPVAEKTTTEKVPDSYKAGHLEISSVTASEKGGAYEIYFTVKNSGKADDGLTSAELTEGTGEIVTVAKITTKEVSNQDAIKKAQDEAQKAASVPPPVATPPKEGEKAEPPKAPKAVEIPKPEYKDVTKDVEGAMISFPADATTKLNSGEAHLKLTGYKKAGKGDTMSVMLHFRSAPNVTLKVKAGAGGSLMNKIFGN